MALWSHKINIQPCIYGVSQLDINYDAKYKAILLSSYTLLFRK